MPSHQFGIGDHLVGEGSVVGGEPQQHECGGVEYPEVVVGQLEPDGFGAGEVPDVLAELDVEPATEQFEAQIVGQWLGYHPDAFEAPSLLDHAADGALPIGTLAPLVTLGPVTGQEAAKLLALSRHVVAISIFHMPRAVSGVAEQFRERFGSQDGAHQRPAGDERYGTSGMGDAGGSGGTWLVTVATRSNGSRTFISETL